jgi:ABC-type transporter Mla MlaB component
MAWWTVGWMGGSLPAPAGEVFPFVTLGGVLEPEDAVALCSVIGAVHRHGSSVVLECDVRQVMNHDLQAVDVLARLQLCGRRHRCNLRFTGVPARLRAVLDLVGASEWLEAPGGTAGTPLESTQRRRYRGGRGQRRYRRSDGRTG